MAYKSDIFVTINIFECLKKTINIHCILTPITKNQNALFSFLSRWQLCMTQWESLLPKISENVPLTERIAYYQLGNTLHSLTLLCNLYDQAENKDFWLEEYVLQHNEAKRLVKLIHAHMFFPLYEISHPTQLEEIKDKNGSPDYIELYQIKGNSSFYHLPTGRYTINYGKPLKMRPIHKKCKTDIKKSAHESYKTENVEPVILPYEKSCINDEEIKSLEWIRKQIVHYYEATNNPFLIIHVNSKLKVRIKKKLVELLDLIGDLIARLIQINPFFNVLNEISNYLSGSILLLDTNPSDIRQQLFLNFQKSLQSLDRVINL